jgi:hypothetical protein
MTKLKIAAEAKPETVAEVVTLGPDPFDLESLRLDPAFKDAAGAVKVLATVPVRKPRAQEWIQVRSGETHRGNFACIKLEEDGEFYLLTPKIALEFERETQPVTLYTAINGTGVVFLWPCRLVAADGRPNLWHTTAHEAAAKAMEGRIRVRANMSLGAYEWATTASVGIAPAWPDVPFIDLVKLAFMKVGRFVSTNEHPLIKQLRGD